MFIQTQSRIYMYYIMLMVEPVIFYKQYNNAIVDVETQALGIPQ